MPIIKCSECGHDVSTYAEQCQNCGCPMNVILSSQELVSNPNLYSVELLSIMKGQRMKVLRFLKESRSLEFDEAAAIADNLPQLITIGVQHNIAQVIVDKLTSLGCECSILKYEDSDRQKTDVAKIESSNLFQMDKPLRCPACGSNQIVTTSRGYSLIWGFAGSNKTVNRCGKCGHTWKP